MSETKKRHTKTKMNWWATLRCGCKLDRVLGTYEDGNPYKMNAEYDCSLHGETDIYRTHGLST